MKMRSFVVFSNHYALHWWSAQCAVRMLLSSSDALMSCCAANTNGCLNLRWRAFAPGGQMSAEWRRCPGSMARRAGDSVAPLRRSSAGWMPARIGRLSAGVGRRHPVTARKASLMTRSMRRVWALRHQAGAQYSAVEWTRARVAIRSVQASKPPHECDAWCLCEVTRGVGDTWATCPTLLRGIWARSKRAGFRCWSWLSAQV